MKKHLITLVICSLYILNGYAQNLRINVKSGSQDLPFSYVLINGAYYSAADSTGMALIPKKQLQIGDTISARYVGAQETSEIFNGQDEMTLNLPGLEIDSIVVLSKAHRKNLWRNINRHKIRKAYQKITCRFEIYKNADTTQVSSGHAKCWIYPKDGEYDIKGDIVCDQNDADFSRPILDIIKVVVNEAFTTVVFRTSVATNKGIKILKENSSDNNLEVYTILRPAIIDEKILLNESTKIAVDPATKDITKSITVQEYKTFTLYCIANFQVIDNYYIPYNIECTITYRKGDPRILNFHIYNLQLDTKRDKKGK